MSLIALYKDELLADQMVVLGPPHAFGLTTLTTKTHMASDKTFAFASVGPTLSETEKGILEEIIRDTFKQAGEEPESLTLTHQDWFDSRTDLEILVMTKNSNYYSHLPESKIQSRRLSRQRAVEAGKHSLIRFDSSIPGLHGTGKYAAHVALMEGVKAKDITGLVSQIEYTVSVTGTVIHRRELKRMVFK